MSREGDLALSKLFGGADAKSQDAFTSLLGTLAVFPHHSLILGGSNTVGSQLPGDIDLWFVVDVPVAVKKHVEHEAWLLPDVNYVHDAGFFPWLGELLTVFFFPDATFIVDIGFCSRAMLPETNTGPSPIFLWGDALSVLPLLRTQSYAAPPTVRLGRLFANLVKVRKNLVRGHLWDATECLTKARRELMGLSLDRLDLQGIRYTRTERRIEEVLPGDIVAAITDTYPQLDAVDIRRAAVRLSELAGTAAIDLPASDLWPDRLSHLGKSIASGGQHPF